MPALVEQLFFTLIPEGCVGLVPGVEHSKSLKLFKKTVPRIVMGFVTLNLCDPLLLILFLPFSQVRDAWASPSSGSTSCTAVHVFSHVLWSQTVGMLPPRAIEFPLPWSQWIAPAAPWESHLAWLGCPGCSQLAGLCLLSPGETAYPNIFSY